VPYSTDAYLNFSDQSHFGRHFRRVYGMTPGAYQQNVAESVCSNRVEEVEKREAPNTPLIRDLMTTSI
jgi:AraC-like DNA-binding protein